MPEMKRTGRDRAQRAELDSQDRGEGPGWGVDILAFGVHPDDVEIGCGATLAKHSRLGFRVAIVDITAGEMATSGSKEKRESECREATAALGVSLRERLDVPDREVAVTRENVMKVVKVIRRLRPRVILAPYWEDRHPDHREGSRLIEEGAFSSGLVRVEDGQPPHRPLRQYYYFVNTGGVKPSFVVGVSDDYDSKREALACYTSQFELSSSAYHTPINDPGYLRMVEARDRYFGSLVGVDYAEGFMATSIIVLDNLLEYGGGISNSG